MRPIARHMRTVQIGDDLKAMIHKLLPAVIGAILTVLSSASAEDLISARGAPAAAEVMNSAAPQIKKDTGFELRIVTEGGNSGAVAGIGENITDVAFLTRKITPQERASWPGRNFQEIQIGKQALLVVVPEQVWKSGVRALSKEQLRAIYEGRMKTWKELGGEDRSIRFFNRDVRSGAWELLMVFLYTDTRKAPESTAEALANTDQVVNAVEFNGGSVSILEFNAPRPATVHALGLRQADGSIVEPTAANVASGLYDFSRPIIAATSRRPTGNLRSFMDYLLSPACQEQIKKAGAVPNAEPEGNK